MRLDKRWLQMALIIGSFLSGTLLSQANAASTDECAIWMCLPTGFTTGCDGAKSAFKKRIRKRKSPLPSFSSCLDSSSSNDNREEFTSKTGFAAYIPSYNWCAKTERRWVRSGEYESVCVDPRTTKPEYRKDVWCVRDRENRTRTPAHCTATYRYTEVYRFGVKFGQTHYYR